MPRKRVKSAYASPVEPKWDPDKGEEQLGDLLNWYSGNTTSKDTFAFFIEHLKKDGQSKKTLQQIQKLESWEVSTSIGKVCRIMDRSESVLPKSLRKRVTDEFKRVKELASVRVKELGEAKPKVRRVSVQESLTKQLNEFLGEIDEQIDLYLLEKKAFDSFQWCSEKKLIHQHAKKISEYYRTGLLKELNDAYHKKDEQLVEGYGFLTRRRLRKYIEFVEAISDGADKWYDAAKQISITNRKPRKRRPKPAGSQVAKLQYLKEFGQYKSILPSKIVGSEQIWVYNTKYRTLGVYVCPNAHGFSVKGCTIQNYDVAASVYKRLRKPDDIIPKVLEAGKVALRKLLPSLRAKEKKLSGRINKHTLILRAL